MHSVLESLQEAETGQRGYIFSGDEQYLGPYYHSATRIAGQLGQLRSVTADNAVDRERVSVLAGITARRIAVLNEGIAIRRSRGLDAAIAQILRGQGKLLMDSARSTVYDMQAVERDYLRDRSAKSETLAGRTELTILLASGLGLLLLAASAALANLEIRARLDAERGLRRVNEELEDRVVTRTEELEGVNQELRIENEERGYAEAQVRSQKDFLRKVVDTNPQLVFIKDWNGRFVLANQRVAELYGTTVEELEGKSDADFNPNAAEVERLLRADRDVMRSERALHISEEAVTDRPSGATRWFHTIKVPLTGPDGRATQVLGVATDITDRRQAEEQLRRTRDELEAARDTLTHMVVHDLRSPLTGLLGYLDLLRLSAAAGAADDILKYAQDATAVAWKLRELVSQVLDVSRLESGQMPVSLVETDLVPLLPSVVALLGPPPPGVKVVYDVEQKPFMATCDRDLVGRVLANLVGNAFKFTPTGGEVRVGLEATNGQARITITDTGPGVAAEHRQMIFEKFGQAPQSQVAGRRSAGLGLTFCKLAVEAHGGRIGVESPSGGGTRFWIEIPRTPQPLPE